MAIDLTLIAAGTSEVYYPFPYRMMDANCVFRFGVSVYVFMERLPAHGHDIFDFPYRPAISSADTDLDVFTTPDVGNSAHDAIGDLGPAFDRRLGAFSAPSFSGGETLSFFYDHNRTFDFDTGYTYSCGISSWDPAGGYGLRFADFSFGSPTSLPRPAFSRCPDGRYMLAIAFPDGLKTNVYDGVGWGGFVTVTASPDDPLCLLVDQDNIAHLLTATTHYRLYPDGGGLGSEPIGATPVGALRMTDGKLVVPVMRDDFVTLGIATGTTDSFGITTWEIEDVDTTSGRSDCTAVVVTDDPLGTYIAVGFTPDSGDDRAYAGKVIPAAGAKALYWLDADNVLKHSQYIDGAWTTPEVLSDPTDGQFVDDPGFFYAVAATTLFPSGIGPAARYYGAMG